MLQLLFGADLSAQNCIIKFFPLLQEILSSLRGVIESLLCNGVEYTRRREKQGRKQAEATQSLERRGT